MVECMHSFFKIFFCQTQKNVIASTVSAWECEEQETEEDVEEKEQSRKK